MVDVLEGVRVGVHVPCLVSKEVACELLSRVLCVKVGPEEYCPVADV